MGEKNQCANCGEMVEEAKAFCPGCGTAFVEEKKRTSVSEFDLSNRTVQLGETMYNQMLSDMGLSVSKAPNRDEGRVETVKPAADALPTVGAPKSSTTLESGAASTRSKNTKLVIALVGLVLLIGILIVALAIFAAVWYLL